MGMAWTKADDIYLRRLKITLGDPPPPLPRFHVEPGPDGEFHVIDTLLKWQYICDTRCSNPKAAADVFAEQWNAEYTAAQQKAE